MQNNQNKLNDKNSDAHNKKSPYNWRYQEVACRCPGGLDVRYNMDQPPFNVKNNVHEQPQKETIDKYYCKPI